MIPKKIHYCWLSEDKLSDFALKCMSTWKNVLPDYEIKLWNTKNFDIKSVPFVEQAYKMRKWAFAADYIRLYAVYNEGGIYLDSDAYVIKSFNDFLHYDFFSSLERDLTTVHPNSKYSIDFKKNENPNLIVEKLERIEGIGIQAAIFGANPGNEYIKDCMTWYENNNFILEDGKLLSSTGIVAPDIYAFIAQKYGFKYESGFQQLQNNMVIFPADYFPNHLYKTDNAYAVHLCENSWSNSRKENKIINIIKHNNLIRTLFSKEKYLKITNDNFEKIIKCGGKYKL